MTLANLFMVIIATLSFSIYGESTVTIRPLNFKAGIEVPSGFLLGRTEGGNVTKTRVILQGGGAFDFPSRLWKVAIPRAWKIDSTKSINVRAYNSVNQLVAQQNFIIRKGLNKDIDGDGYSDIVVGDPVEHNKVHVYRGGPSGLQSTPLATTAEIALGYSVSMAGDVNGDGFGDIIVCRYPTLSPSGITSGGGYVYYGNPSGFIISNRSPLQQSVTGLNVSLGANAAPAGDVNGDGYDDIMLSVDTFQIHMSGVSPLGGADNAVQLHLGGANGISGAASQILLSTEPAPAGFNQMGFSMIPAGDLNGDGFADVAITDPLGGYTSSQIPAGRVYIHFGNSTGLESTPRVTGRPPPTQSSLLPFGFGRTVALGDLNGDGRKDLAIGAPTACMDTTSYFGCDAYTVYGAVYIYQGPLSQFPTNPTRLNFDDNGMQASSLGSGIDIADINGDGISDLVASLIRQYDNVSGGYFPGDAFYVYHGSLAGVSTLPNYRIRTGTDLALGKPVAFGGGTASLRDLTGDGLAELVSGGMPDFTSPPSQGRIQLFRGRTAGLTPVPVTTLYSPNGFSRTFGRFLD